MNPFDILKLGHLQFSSHKLRSLLTIIATGILFSALFTVQFILKGLENTLLAADRAITGEEILLLSYDSHETFDDEGNLITIYREDRIRELATANHGDIVGQAHQLQQAYIFPAELVTNFPWGNLSSRPANTIPIMLPPQFLSQTKPYAPLDFSETASLIQQYDHQTVSLNANAIFSGNTSLSDDPEPFYTQFYIARLAPDGYHNLTLPTTDFSDLLNLPLQLMGHPTNYTVIFDDDSEAIQDFLAITANQSLINQNPITNQSPALLITRFTNSKNAYNYTVALSKLSTNATHTGTINLFGDTINTVRSSRHLETLLFIPEVILLITATIIMSLTFTSLIRENATIIALYRSAGATRRNLFLIHLVYLADLCLSTTIFAFAIGAALATLLSKTIYTSLSETIAATYMIEQPSSILLIGFSWHTALTICLMLSIPFIASLITYDQLSVKNLAQHLKSTD